MELTGTIKLINDTQHIGSNGFRKREFVLTTDDQYPQHILLECTQDKVELLNNFRIGQAIKALINVRGREVVNSAGEAKYYNTLQVWRIENP